MLASLGIDEQQYDRWANFAPQDQTPQDADVEHLVLGIPVFFKHEIPKKGTGGGTRVAWEIARPEDAHIYKAIARRLRGFFEHALPQFPHACSFGFTPGRNIKENARRHCGKKFLLNVDIENFFGSIDAGRIDAFLTSLGIAAETAAALSQILTIEGILPLGFPTSPVLSDAICNKLDQQLYDFAVGRGFTYGRYADDIAFSSDSSWPQIAEVSEIVSAYGFNLCDRKTQTSKIGQAHYVTGLSVSDGAGPHVPRKMKKRLRQILHYCEKHSLNGHLDHQGVLGTAMEQPLVNHLDGLVRYVSHIEPTSGMAIKEQWARLLRDSEQFVSFQPRKQGRATFCLGVDEAEYHLQGRKFLALAIVSTQHENEIRKATDDLLKAYLFDPWSAGQIASLQKRGVHFTDCTEDLKLAYVAELQSLHFSGYVAFTELQDPKDYSAKYLELLAALIKRRLMAAESKFAFLYFEKNNKVKQGDVVAVVKAAYDQLALANNRRPAQYTVQFRNKPDSMLSVPDFLLAVLQRYLTKKGEAGETPTPRDVLLFERIRDKYRLIYDLDSGSEYSRRNPI